MINKVAIAGAGTMGSGIALSVAMSDIAVILFDVQEVMLEKARLAISKNLEVLLKKGKISSEEKNEISSRITYTNHIEEAVADVVIEAIVEKLPVKVDLFQKLAAINHPDTILASNTSSLSVSDIQKEVPAPERVAGLHYFNPAQVMKLVEVVKGERTSGTVIQRLVDFTKSQKKVPVVCHDSPGFIVNRVARHFYLESMKLVEDGIATVEEVDSILEASGFKMGPFRLMDMIGMDINLAVTESLYEAFNQHIRFTPSSLQIQKVNDGELGRKTGKGFYTYNSPAS
ncbi:MAG: 3-hydroxybutyryl-CoA dehydrogenase [Chitinophagaceae bacterium]|nr:MAG: 3-hydroxybutyryl-CoA dehydrogenase [Chitinophagaceae bacterium]